MTARPWRRWDARYGVALAALLAAALALRLWGIRSGLPWVYNVDEADHFVPEALRMLHGNLEPHTAGGSVYLANPPAFTYLIALACELWFGGLAAAGHVYRSRDPTEVWVVARACSALLGTFAVWLLYGAGRRLFDRRTGLLAAATMAVAFLPVFYSKLALNDAPALAGVCLSLWGSAAVLRGGGRRAYLLAGAGLGVAAATKYTGGVVVLALLAAAVARAAAAGGAANGAARAAGAGADRAGGGAAGGPGGATAADRRAGPGARREAAAGIALAAVAALAAFIALNPYSVGDWNAFTLAISHQSSESAQTGKLGLTHGGGIGYYLWSLTWGLGWAPAIAAGLGALALVWRDRPAAALLVPSAVAYLIFMGLQGRYFGRWVMPVVPIACLLAAYAAVAGARALTAGSRVAEGVLAAAFAAGLLVQGVVDGVHSGVVGARADTRAGALAYLIDTFAPHTRVVVEPIAPSHWGGRFSGFPALLSHRGRDGRLRIYAGRPVTLENYERTLSPALIRLYERGDFCVVVTGSTEQGRAAVDPASVPGAIAYYRALAAQGTLLYSASPYSAGAAAPAFNFDWSFDYYPSAYARPGPSIAIYELHGGRCAAQPPRRRARAAP